MSLTSKANEMRALGEDIIVLTVGEPDFDTPQYIKKAGQEAIESGKTNISLIKEISKYITFNEERFNGWFYIERN